jgi:hypothetical protein
MVPRPPLALISLAALLALAACETMPSGSTPLAGSQPVVTSTPASTTTTVVTTTPSTTAIVAPGGVIVGTNPAYPASSISTVSTSTVVTGPARLTGAEIRALLADNTVSGQATNGQLYFAWFGHDGRLKYRQDDFRDGGGWRIASDSQFCSTLTRINVGVEDCYSLYREGAAFRFDRPDGQKIGSFTVLPGNPQNL